MATLQVITSTNSSYGDAYEVVAGCPSNMKSYLLTGGLDTDSYENVIKKRSKNNRTKWMFRGIIVYFKGLE